MLEYTASQEFDQLKRYRSVAAARIAKQEELLGKVVRGKTRWSSDISMPILYALVKHDMKLLEKARNDMEKRLPELRQKIHEEILVDCRSNSGNDSV